jgi:hypothetical protein
MHANYRQSATSPDRSAVGAHAKGNRSELDLVPGSRIGAAGDCDQHGRGRPLGGLLQRLRSGFSTPGTPHEPARNDRP